jgi:hypothetical protein
MTRTEALTGAELVDRIAVQATWLAHRLNDLLDDDSDAADVLRDNLTGQLTGMRWVVCLLKGWDPARGSAGIQGRADLFLRNWHNLPGHCNRNGCRPW